MTFATCPQCGARSLRASKLRGFRERLQAIVGIMPFRCRQCSARFSTQIWDLHTWRYARCPKCLRYELSTWSEHYHNATMWVNFLIRMGATPYRCESCRCNFASYRELKERFSWRKHGKGQSKGSEAARS